MVSSNLILRREIESKSYECIATIRVKENKSYLTTVLKLAKEGGIIDEACIIKELFPSEPIRMASNMIRRYQQLGFLNENGSLTELGDEATNGNVFMPERGKYLISVSSDPVITGGFIEIKAKDNKNGSMENTENPKKKPDPSDKIPEILSQCEGKRSLVWFNEKIEEVWIEKISNIVKKIESSQKYKSEITVGYNGAFLKLSRNKSEISFPLNNGIDLEEVWESIVYSKSWDWHGEPLQKGISLVRYRDIKMNEKEVKSFTKIIPAFKLNLEDLGDFIADPIELNIQPVSSVDANDWALDLIRFNIVDYIDQKAFDQIVINVEKKFTYYHPEIPTMEDFMEYLLYNAKQSARGIPLEYWYIRAPLDLVLEEN